ncbi:unnamed protein product [Brachionus calyciflorus]|uniref:FLYWCH-type domain-containing protein n=1 Tax=Brachionus calyciflorus TaxID=104777 RepID=A0A814FY83_9BILA|nr:unnamed protein product [Brachionus calyciflorus]
MSNDQILFIKNNLPVQTNKKSNTSRYVCCYKVKSKCSASITIRNVDNSSKRFNGNHSCNAMMNDARLAANKAKQEMRTNVHTNRVKTLRECYNDAQRNLVSQNIPERAIAAYFPTFNKISRIKLMSLLKYSLSLFSS